MHVDRRYIRSLDRYLSILPSDSPFKVVADATEAAIAKVGFTERPADHATLLPAIIGRVTRFNAEGRWTIRRDLPKELRYIGSRSWVRVEWHGQDKQEVEDTVDINRWCYPRERVDPPSVELTFLDHDERPLFSSPTLAYAAADADKNIHVINMMLELFGSCDIVRENLELLSPPVVRRVNWVMLPPGEHPWSRIEEHIKDVFSGKSPSIAKVALERQKTISSFGASAIYKGIAGFSDYIAYHFSERKMVVLESIHYGNALYVFGDDWEALSRLTKAEIIRQELAAYRIVHSQGWPTRLSEAMRKAA